MFVDMLTLNSAVTIFKHVDTPDGMGGATTVTTSTVLAKAQIWQSGTSRGLISDKFAKDSTHILAWRTSEYTLTDYSSIVTWKGDEYHIRGVADDVANQGIVSVVPLERIV